MTLQQVADEAFKNVTLQIQTIVIGTADENNNFHSNDWDYADEMLELYGDQEVVDYEYFEDRALLAAVLQKTQNTTKIKEVKK